MSWAESITDDRMRTRLMERVAGSWKDEDPEAFQTYIETTEMSAEQRGQLLKAESRSGERSY